MTTQTKPLSASCLKSLAQSPEHCFAKHLDPTRQLSEPSDAMLLGSLIHMMQLERDLAVDTRYAVMPEGMVKRGKKWDDFYSSAEASGLQIVRNSVYQQALHISGLMDQSELCASLLNGRKKTTRYEYKFHHSDHGTLDKPVITGGYIDCMNTELKRCVDIKTLSNADNVQKSAADGRWDLQACHYLNFLDSVFHETSLTSPRSRWAMMFLVVETKLPFRIRAVQLSPDAMQAGYRSRAKLMDEFMRRLDANDWSGQSDEPETISMPGWFNYNLED